MLKTLRLVVYLVACAAVLTLLGAQFDSPETFE